MPIRGVTFDLWQTLLMDNRDLGLSRMRVRLEGTMEALSEAGEKFTKDQVDRAYRQCHQACSDIRAQGRDVSFTEQIEIFIENIDPGLEDRLDGEVVRRISTTYADSFFCHPPVPHADAAPVLDSLKENGYRLGLISNTGMTPGVIFRTYMEQIGILSYFDALTFSDEVRLSKPSAEIFIRGAEPLGIPLEQVVHVGDHLLNDVLGASRLGMKTIWIETYEEGRTPVEVAPDATVKSLGDVTAAVESLSATLP